MENALSCEALLRVQLRFFLKVSFKSLGTLSSRYFTSVKSIRPGIAHTARFCLIILRFNFGQFWIILWSKFPKFIYFEPN